MSGLAIKEGLPRLRHLLRRLCHLDGRRRLLLVEASALLLLSRLVLIVVPFRHLAPRLGTLAQPEETHDAPADQERPVAEIAVTGSSRSRSLAAPNSFDGHSTVMTSCGAQERKLEGRISRLVPPGPQRPIIPYFSYNFLLVLSPCASTSARGCDEKLRFSLTEGVSAYRK